MVLPTFNGGAFAPVTPNNGNPNTVYNRKKDGPKYRRPNTYVPTFTPVREPGTSPRPVTTLGEPRWAGSSRGRDVGPNAVSYGGLTVPRVTDTNADRRSPLAITLPDIQAPSSRLRGTAFGSSTDHWRERLASLRSELPTFPLPGAGNTQRPPTTAPPSPIPPDNTLPLPPDNTLPLPPDGPIAGAGVAAPALNTADFWRVWNEQNSRNPGRFNSPMPESMLRQLNLPSGTSVSGGFRSIVNNIGRELRDGVPLTGVGFLGAFVDTLIPGLGATAMRMVNSNQIPLQELQRMDLDGFAQSLFAAHNQESMRDARLQIQQDMALLDPRNAGAAIGPVAPAFNPQEYWSAQDEMSSQEWRNLQNRFGMANAFASGNAASWVPQTGGGLSAIGGYMAPGAAVALSGFQQAGTGRRDLAQEALQRQQQMARNIGRNITR